MTTWRGSDELLEELPVEDEEEPPQAARDAAINPARQNAMIRVLIFIVFLLFDRFFVMYHLYFWQYISED
jgi:hypothetical protein